MTSGSNQIGQVKTDFDFWILIQTKLSHKQQLIIELLLREYTDVLAPDRITIPASGNAPKRILFSTHKLN